MNIMKFTEDIRRENLALLVDEFGSLTALAKHLDREDSQISQWINASTNSGTGKPRNMRPSTARWIEEAVGKPTGWLDQDHSIESKAPENSGRSNAAEPDPILVDLALIARYTPEEADLFRAQIRATAARLRREQHTHSRVSDPKDKDAA